MPKIKNDQTSEQAAEMIVMFKIMTGKEGVQKKNNNLNNSSGSGLDSFQSRCRPGAAVLGPQVKSFA